MIPILFIAYHFPPRGGAGVQRSVKFVKYLPALGFQPIVLTAENAQEKWAPNDETLAGEVGNISVFRARITCATSRNKRRIANLLALPSPFGKTWAQSAFEEGCRIIEQFKPRLIFISMSPFEGATAAAALSKKYGIPWIADLRDPWALDEIQVYPSSLHRVVEKRRMQAALLSAETIIMNTPEAARRLVAEFPDFTSKRITHITNGYDGEDFAGDPIYPEEKFTIVHSGFLHTEAGLELRRKRRSYEALGRIVPGVDFLTRSHFFLVQAIEQWLKKSPQVASNLRIRFIGAKNGIDENVVQSDKVRQLTRFEGYLPHKASVGAIRAGNLLFLPMHNLPLGHRATIVPGKTYEYMATGRPILAAVPEGDAKDFLIKANVASFAFPSNLNGIQKALEDAFSGWKLGKGTTPNTNFIRSFERRELTSRLGEELETVLRAISRN